MPSWKRNPFLWAALASLSIAAGCTNNDGRRPIHGEVTLDGKPASGAIVSFRATAGSQGNSSGTVADEHGRFAVPADKGLMPGTYAVTVQLWNTTGHTAKDPCSGQVVAVATPIEYAQQGKLQITVTPDGDSQFNFPLTSAGK